MSSATRARSAALRRRRLGYGSAATAPVSGRCARCEWIDCNSVNIYSERLISYLRIISEEKPVFNQERQLADGRTFERDFLPGDPNNQYQDDIWAYKDITARKQDEIELNRSKELFELFFSQSYM